MEEVNPRVKGQILYHLYSRWGCHEALLLVVISSFPLKTGQKINVNNLQLKPVFAIAHFCYTKIQQDNNSADGLSNYTTLCWRFKEKSGFMLTINMTPAV